MINSTSDPIKYPLGETPSIMVSPSDHEKPNLQNKRPAGFVLLLLDTADTTFDFTDGVFKIVVDAGDGHFHYNYRCG